MQNNKVVYFNPPKQVWFPCEEINVDDHPFRYVNEVIVNFTLNGKPHIGFMQKEYVDCERKLLAAEIVAEDGEDIIMGIPAETFTTGSRVRVPPADQPRIVPLEAA